MSKTSLSPVSFDIELKKRFDKWVDTDRNMKELCENGIFEAFAYLAFIEGRRQAKTYEN